MPRTRHGFTLIELLVVVTIIVVLVALLTPALDKAFESAHKAVCGANLKGIAQGSTEYALLNKSQFIICRGRQNQFIFSPQGHQQYEATADDAKVDWLAALASVGLANPGKTSVGAETWAGVGTVNAGATMQVNDIGKMWDCPSRAFASRWDSQYGQMLIAYQYFGGIKTWRNSANSNPGFVSRSPVTLNRSSGNWAIAADMTARINRTWGFDNNLPGLYGDPVAHKGADNLRPAGGNNAYVDGSVAWSPFDRMVYIHLFTDQASAQAFWQQDDLGDYGPAVLDEARGENIHD